MRAIKSKKVKSNFKQYKMHAKRLVTKPKKHLKKTPVRRLEGIRKARKNSLKTRLIRSSNALEEDRGYKCVRIFTRYFDKFHGVRNNFVFSSHNKS